MPCVCSVCGGRCDCDEIVCSNCLIKILSKEYRNSIGEDVKEIMSEDSH